MGEYILGVDGGGTKTHYALFDIKGNMVEFLESGPVNHEVLEEGFEGSKRELHTSISKILKKAGKKQDDIGYAVFGLAGADISTQKKELKRIVLETGITRIKVVNDAFLTIKAGSRFRYGIGCINGTGTCCVGIGTNGGTIQVGGTGYFFGDEAGSSHIGNMVIRKVYDSVFRCGTETMMTDMLLDELEIDSVYELVDAVYAKVYTDKINVNEFNRICFKAANQGDKVAIYLLKHIGKEMALSILGAINNLCFSGTDEIDVVLAGSVNVNGENPNLLNTLQDVVKEKSDKRIIFNILKEPPVLGAVLWALEEVIGDIPFQLKQKITKNIGRSN